MWVPLFKIMLEQAKYELKSKASMREKKTAETGKAVKAALRKAKTDLGKASPYPRLPGCRAPGMSFFWRNSQCLAWCSPIEKVASFWRGRFLSGLAS